jgi:hypothetical protein
LVPSLLFIVRAREKSVEVLAQEIFAELVGSSNKRKEPLGVRNEKQYTYFDLRVIYRKVFETVSDFAISISGAFETFVLRKKMLLGNVKFE